MLYSRRRKHFTEYRPYMHTNRPIPWEEIFEDWEKKPRVIRYSRFFKYLPQRVQDYLLFQDERKACNRIKIFNSKILITADYTYC